MELSALLAEGLSKLQLALDTRQQQLLLDYLALLQKWNRAYNLTAVRDASAMVPRHVLDSLSIYSYIKGPRVLDVGSGAGLPGIPLAIALPHLAFVLLDSNGKKTRFLQQVATELSLGNVSVECRRVEQYQPEQLFQTVTCRAYSDLATIVQTTRHVLAVDGQILAMKATLAGDELALLAPCLNAELLPLQVPGLEAQRQLVRIRIS
jgi:16S rRNA (guanine527-N7)-methyltransferase